jgi:hypothetical protein
MMKHILFLLLLLPLFVGAQIPTNNYAASKAGGRYQLTTSVQVDTSDAPKDALGGTIRSQQTVVAFADSAEASNYLLNLLTRAADQLADERNKLIALDKEFASIIKEYNTLFGANAYERAVYRIVRDQVGNNLTIRENGQRVGVYDLGKGNASAWNFNILEGTTSRGRLVVYSSNLAELRNWNGITKIDLIGNIQSRAWYGEYLKDGKLARIKLISTAPPTPKEPSGIPSNN